MHWIFSHVINSHCSYFFCCVFYYKHNLHVLQKYNFANFHPGSTLEPPAKENVDAAVLRLQHVGAFDKEKNLTPLGHHLATLPVDVRIGKLILYGAIFRCADAALTMAACLNYKSPFVSPFGKRDIADEKKRKFAVGNSDQLTILTAYRAS